MNPEMNDPVLGLAGIAIVANLALVWVFAGGLRGLRGRLQSRRGGKR